MRKVFLGGNDYVFRRAMQTDGGAPATGLTLTGYLTATKNGAAIDALLSKSLTDTGQVEDGFELYASAPVVPADLTTLLAAYAGKVIFDRCVGSTYGDNEPVLVVAARPAGE